MPPQQPEDDDDEPKEDEGEFVPGLGGGGIGRIKIADFGLSKASTTKGERYPINMHDDHSSLIFLLGGLGPTNNDTLWYCWLYCTRDCA